MEENKAKRFDADRYLNALREVKALHLEQFFEKNFFEACEKIAEKIREGKTLNIGTIFRKCINAQAVSPSCQDTRIAGEVALIAAYFINGSCIPIEWTKAIYELLGYFDKCFVSLGVCRVIIRQTLTGEDVIITFKEGL